MTNWMPLFRTLTASRQAYRALLPYEVVADRDDDTWLPSMALRLYMAPMPEGHAIGISDQVLNYQMEMKA